MSVFKYRYFKHTGLRYQFTKEVDKYQFTKEVDKALQTGQELGIWQASAL